VKPLRYRLRDTWDLIRWAIGCFRAPRYNG